MKQLTWHFYPFFSGLAALMSVILHETLDYWSVAVFYSYHTCPFFIPTFDFVSNKMLSLNLFEPFSRFFYTLL